MSLLNRKLRRDIWANPGQFVLMALAVFLSVFALMTLIASLVSIQKATNSAYLGTNPAQATIETDGKLPLPNALNLPGASSEQRGSVLGRIADSQGKWYPLLIFVIEDFSAMHIGVSVADQGAWPPPDGTIALERTALELVHYQIGQMATVILPGSTARELRLSGTSHDQGLAPAWQERTAYGYISLATARNLFGASWQLAELKLAWDDHSLSAAEIRAKADQVASQLELRNYRVEEIQVPPPRMHPHQTQMNTILTIFLVFAGLALVLSAILLATMLRSLLVRETRSIGIMKTLGASPAVLVGHYLKMSLIPALLGSLIAVPCGLLAASGLTNIIVQLLNFETGTSQFPWAAIPIPLLAGLLVPTGFTVIPVLAAIRQSVRSALEGQSPPRSRQGTARLRLPVSLALSIQNLGRRKGSLALTLGLLACGGMVFMTALNITSGWKTTLQQGADSKKYDLEIRLDKPLNQAEALTALRAMPAIKTVEAWSRIEAYPASSYRHPITTQYPDRGHGSFSVRAMPDNSSLFFPNIIRGQTWAENTPSNIRPVILNQNALALFPKATIGSIISLIIDSQARNFTLIAIVQEISPSCAWVRPGDFASLIGSSESVSNSFYIAFAPGLANRATLAATAEAILINLGGSVELSLPESEFDSALGNHVLILIVALAAMAVLIGLVGLLGLSATMGTSVLDRTREIGIMRAIGAQPMRILRLILGEAALQALGGLVFAGLLSLPATLILGNFIGLMSFRVPLDFSLNASGIIICALVLPLGALLATFGSARLAAKLSVRSALAYE